MHENNSSEVETTAQTSTPPRNADGPGDGDGDGDNGHDDSGGPKTPPRSPALSLFSLDMSPFSPSRLQFSLPGYDDSSPARSPSPSASPPQLSQTDAPRERSGSSAAARKDALVQRLRDLAARVDSEEGETREEGVEESLHAKVDELERLLVGGGAPRPRRKPDSLGADDSVPKLLAETQELNASLTTAVASLKARQEETDHIYDMLITRAERAAQRIIYLEARLGELETERNEGEMEVLNLQIQLKAIEVRCLNYVPRDADPELIESIEAWKADWSALKRKRARIKDDSGVISTPTPKTPAGRVLGRRTTPG